MKNVYKIIVHKGGLRGPSVEQVEEEMNRIANEGELELVAFNAHVLGGVISIWKKKNADKNN